MISGNYEHFAERERQNLISAASVFRYFVTRCNGHSIIAHLATDETISAELFQFLSYS